MFFGAKQKYGNRHVFFSQGMLYLAIHSFFGLSLIFSLGAMASSGPITEEGSIPRSSFDSLTWHGGRASVSQRWDEGRLRQMCLSLGLHHNGSHGLCDVLIGCLCRYWCFIALPGPPIFTRWLGCREDGAAILLGMSDWIVDA